MNLSEQIHDALCELVNEEINNSGKIQRSNQRIWRALHSMDDGIWRAVLEGALADQRYAEIQDITKLLLQHLDQHKEWSPWCLTPYPGLVKRQNRSDLANAKSLVWRWLMQSREIYTQAQGWNFPNEDSSKGSLNTVTNTAFDWNPR
jgi:hypothetical protein